MRMMTDNSTTVLENVSTIPIDGDVLAAAPVAREVLLPDEQMILETASETLTSLKNVVLSTTITPGGDDTHPELVSTDELMTSLSSTEEVVAAMINQVSMDSALEELATQQQSHTPTGFRTPNKSATPTEFDADDDYDYEDDLNEMNTDSPDSINRKIDEQNSSYLSRQEKSLGLLTSRFVTLLQDCPDGVMDLKMVKYCF